MSRNKDAEDYVTYTIITRPAQDGIAADTTKIKIAKFTGGNPKDWLWFTMRFKMLVAKKKWTLDQAAGQLLILIEGQLGDEVQVLAQKAKAAKATFEPFYCEVGLLSVPADFAEDLEDELWGLTKRRGENVQSLGRRLKEIVRYLAELPAGAQNLTEAQQCRYFKRAMPKDWQDRLTESGETYRRLAQLITYFERLEKNEKRKSSNPFNGNKGSSNQQQAKKTNNNNDNNKGGQENKNKGKARASFALFTRPTRTTPTSVSRSRSRSKQKNTRPWKKWRRRVTRAPTNPATVKTRPS
jgi:hypothetical protein